MSLRTTTFVIFLLAGIVLALVFVIHERGTTTFVKADTQKETSAKPRTPGVATPILMELYTSEGCSSCPPADALLASLGHNQPMPGTDLIVLEEHVDYWDSLGWKDPFSSEAMTLRQSEYAEAIGNGQVYTPEMVVDGRTGFVGSSSASAMRAIVIASTSAKPAMHLAWTDDGKLSIHSDQLTGATPGDQPEIYLVVAESKLHSDVKRGENAGRALEHTGVVRRLETVGKADAGAQGFTSSISIPVAPDWKRENLRAVVFVQERRSRHVLAAAAIQFPVG